jgi:ABC-type multidrug transport system fused ATPase/permease subunit
VITLPDPGPATLDARSPGRLLADLARQQRRTLLAGGVIGTVWSLTQAGIPLVVGRTIDAGLVRWDGVALLTGCVVLVSLGAASAVTGVLRHRLAVSTWMQAALRSQRAVGHHVADQGPAVAAGTTTGEVVETVSGDAPRIGDLFEISARATGSLITFTVVAVVLLRMDLVVGLWVAAGLPLLTATLAVVVRPLQARQRDHRDAEGRLTALGADTVAGLRVLRGIGGEEQFLGRYIARSQAVRRAGVRVASLQAGLDAAHVLLPGVFVVALTWLGARAALSGRLSAGELVTFYGYAAFLRMPLETATETLSKATRGWVAAGRVVAVLARTDGAASGTLRPAVDLAAGVRDGESGVSVPAGALTGLVTARPEDAAEVAEALGRLDTDLDRARILVGEAEPRLFSGRLRTGLDPYERHDDGELLAAVEVADAVDVLDALPAGLDAEVEERGRDFSGGQRQRLALARAVLADPEVLVLVEPTSAVDAHTEARIARRLRRARAGRATLVATASPLLLEECDRVLFLAGGRVRAEGTHGELLRDDPDYRDVVARGGAPDGG